VVENLSAIISNDLFVAALTSLGIFLVNRFEVLPKIDAVRSRLENRSERIKNLVALNEKVSELEGITSIESEEDKEVFSDILALLSATLVLDLDQHETEV
jgi:hypothetical protein